MRPLGILACGVAAALWALPASAVEPPVGCPGAFEWAVVDRVNVERVSRGLNPLEMDVRLMEAAQLHSLDMATNNFHSHTGSDGSDPGDRIEDAGYLGWTGWGENVAAGYSTPDSVVDAWMNSPGHRSNILGASYDHIGVGYRYGAATTYSHYWTQDFGSAGFPAALPLAVCPGCANGADDDGDGGVDAGEDIGCRDALWPYEDPECADGINNDPGGDPDPGLVDFDGGQSVHGYCSGGTCPAGVSDPDGDGVADPDPQCTQAWSRESRGCGLGFELAMILPGLMWLHRRRRRRH
jgi:uncharacterized protein YkwD